MQLDELTDLSSISHLVVFVRYVANDSICYEFLLCKALTKRAADIFKIIDDFFKKHDVAWTKAGSVYTFAAPSMLGHQSGFVALMKTVVPDIISLHCVFNRCALASITVPEVFKEVISTAVKAVNFVCVQHRLFKEFCEEVGADYSLLLPHTKVRWLSMGRVLNRVVELSQKMAIFCKKLAIQKLLLLNTKNSY